MGAAGVLAASLIPASAIDLNLTTAGASDTINGAIFQQVADQSTGTGVIEPFYRLAQTGNNTSAEGYNATARPVMQDVNTSGTWTHDLQLGSVPVVTLGGTAYYQFLLDINQANPSTLSLDKIEIYTRSTALTTANTKTALTTGSDLRYSLDAGGNNRILLDYALNSGSGSGDMFAYIPVSAFAGDALTDYVYLYSQFGASGAPYTENDGFEEWSILKGPATPPPSVPDAGASLALLGMGLVGVEALRRKLS